MSTQDAGPKLRPKPGRVVAELGRPETPEETAARKAENSRAHRANQTTRNLVFAIIASLGIVLIVALVVVRPQGNLVKPINYVTAAAQAQPSVDATLAAPKLPSGWHSNDAELKDGTGSATTWYVGLITPKQQFIAIEEGIKTGDTWYGSLLGTAQPTGHVTIAGVPWTVYNQRSNSNAGNFGYSLTSTINKEHYILHGSASDAEFTVLATALANELGPSTSSGAQQ